MPNYSVEWRQVVQQYWEGEVEADSEDEARDKFLDEIQGTEPNDEDVTDAWSDITLLD
jgi:hypothetical protein